MMLTFSGGFLLGAIVGVVAAAAAIAAVQSLIDWLDRLHVEEEPWWS
jgi:hypothetical protein